MGDIYVIGDTHGEDIPNKWLQKGDTLIHIGDYEHGMIPDFEGKIILIRGNHDASVVEDNFDFIADGILLRGIWFTHEPAVTLPRGASVNICGHTHTNNPDDYGYPLKPFHRILPPNKLMHLDDAVRLQYNWMLHE